MIPSDEKRRPHCRFFVSGLYLFSFGLSLGAVGLISGCDDDKGRITQIVEHGNPAERAKDSMKFYTQEKMKKPGGSPPRSKIHRSPSHDCSKAAGVCPPTTCSRIVGLSQSESGLAAFDRSICLISRAIPYLWMLSVIIHSMDVVPHSCIFSARGDSLCVHDCEAGSR